MEIHQITGLYSISSFTLDIIFPFRENNPNDEDQVLTGPVETFIDNKLVSSEEWKEQVPDEKEVENEKYANPRQSDGRNKRAKAKARANQHRGGFYFEPPDCLKHSESGVIVIDNKNEYCFKYTDVLHFITMTIRESIPNDIRNTKNILINIIGK